MCKQFPLQWVGKRDKAKGRKKDIDLKVRGEERR
jgi:hypothetical protein